MPQNRVSDTIAHMTPNTISSVVYLFYVIVVTFPMTLIEKVYKYCHPNLLSIHPLLVNSTS